MGGADRPAGSVEFEQVAADHPLYVLYSSGTTGMPKPITHGHGGILLEHLKVFGLHADLGPADRFFWFTTTGWMMWNYLVSGLLTGAAIVTFDGDPAVADARRIVGTGRRDRDHMVRFQRAVLHDVSQGRPPARRAVRPVALRAVGSTGAPLPADGFHWIYDEVGGDVMLSSISGGTDICSAFVGGCPMVPVVAGEISCRYLGAAVEAFDETGRSVVGEQGELVVTKPMPSMPIGFWGDDDGSRYRAAYFDSYPGVWRHGDWITLDEKGSCIITGRSDATLNRGGVRIGTSEIYRVVEAVDGVERQPDRAPRGHRRRRLGIARAVRRARRRARSSTNLIDPIKRALRSNLSPRHVPDEIYPLPSIPTTLSGKKLELPVKKILRGADPDSVASRGALKNPESLDAVAAVARSR